MTLKLSMTCALYDRSQPCQQRFGETDVINVFPYRLLAIAPVEEPAEPA